MSAIDRELVETVNRQLLVLDREGGSDAIATDVAGAIARAVQEYEGDASREGLLRELLLLHDVLLEMRPRVASIILDIQKLLLHVHQSPNATQDDVLRFLQDLTQARTDRRQQVARVAAGLFVEPQTLLLHSYSTTLEMLLRHLAEIRRKPRVIVAQQQEVRTRGILRALQSASYDYTVVSEYSLSHMAHELSCALFAGLTITLDERIVLSPGSANLIEHLRSAGIPTYVILTTNKWSYWTEETETAYREEREKSIGDLRFRKQVFSHDPVPLSSIAGIITEEGVLDAEKTREVYEAEREVFQATEELIVSLERDLGIE